MRHSTNYLKRNYHIVVRYSTIILKKLMIESNICLVEEASDRFLTYIYIYIYIILYKPDPDQRYTRIELMSSIFFS